MIVHVVDSGWGNEWELKKIEQQILQDYLRPYYTDASRTVIINSTWYTNDVHQATLKKLQALAVDRIVLVAMLDTAIPQPEWFSELDCEIVGVGYYAGDHCIDYWAMMAHKYINVTAYPDLMDHTKIDTAFMCLNRKPHWHRRQLYNQLAHFDLLDRNIVSMGGDDEHPVQRVLPNDEGGTNIAPNAGRDQHGIANDIASLGNPVNWQRHLVNVVTETTWDIDRHHFVSEKIFKPIMGLKPFLVYDPTGAVPWLYQRGFESFHEDFQDITDQDLSLAPNIAPFLAQLTRQNTTYFQSKFVALREKIMYNRSVFGRYVAEQKQKIQQGIQCPV